MIAQLRKAAEIAQKSLDKPKLALSFNMKVSDTSYDALKEGIEKDLKSLANDITLQNEAKEDVWSPSWRRLATLTSRPRSPLRRRVSTHWMCSANCASNSRRR